MEDFKDYKRSLFQKKYGSFTSDCIPDGSKKFNEVMEAVDNT